MLTPMAYYKHFNDLFENYFTFKGARNSGVIYYVRLGSGKVFIPLTISLSLRSSKLLNIFLIGG